MSFENGREDGYFSEKIVNAFLGGSIPIYLGDPGIEEVFNGNSFVNCNEGGLDECADRVLRLWLSGEWEQMAEAVNIEELKLEEEFGWSEGLGRLPRELKTALASARAA